ncbi:glutamate receptor ionotropic, kainate 5 [Platysternon megacephalum]|uniref:Glutamate receptor ionotropic, kainate 5 n=1 Tax=Platysternon megacephalum TaxID=55544 RepID=A0A4D9DRR8_9SAUR|nr:glutamate receptor ionotropic, kainate 5 [Platysternon megacephalum]
MGELPPGVGTVLSVEVPKGEGCKQGREQHPSGGHLPPRAETPTPHTYAASRAQLPRPQALGEAGQWGRSLTCPPNSSDKPLGQVSTVPFGTQGHSQTGQGRGPTASLRRTQGSPSPVGGRGVLHSIKTIPLT